MNPSFKDIVNRVLVMQNAVFFLKKIFNVILMHRILCICEMNFYDSTTNAEWIGRIIIKSAFFRMHLAS